MTEVLCVNAATPAGNLVELMRSNGDSVAAIQQAGSTYLVGFGDVVEGAIAGLHTTVGQLVVSSSTLHALPDDAFSVIGGGRIIVATGHLANLTFTVAGYKHCGGDPSHIYPANSSRTTCSIDGTALVDFSGQV
jgi:hypothetical protein